MNVNAETTLLFLALIAVLGGAAGSVRELIKERAMYIRERTAGLSAGAYLLSKIAVLGLISTKLKDRLHSLLSDVLVEATTFDGFSGAKEKMDAIRASTIGDASSTWRPSGETMRSMTRLTWSSSSNWTSLSCRRPLRSK